MREFERITRATLLLQEFLPAAKNLLDQMINQGGSKHMLLKKIKKDIQRLFKNIILKLQILKVKLPQLK